jgi:hypothetical protein
MINRFLIVFNLFAGSANLTLYLVGHGSNINLLVGIVNLFIASLLFIIHD